MSSAGGLGVSARRLRAAGALLFLASLLVGCPRKPDAAAEASGRTPPAETVSKAQGTQETQRTQEGVLVTLRASHRLGVPLHPEAHAKGVSGRLPDGAQVRVMEVADDGNWLRVTSVGGPESSGWIVSRYLAEPRKGASDPSALAAEPQPAQAAAAQKAGANSSAMASLLAASSPLASEAACLKALARAPRHENPRLATYNVRWFPDGKPGKKAPSGGGVSLPWLACQLAGTGAEVVFLQEIKTSPRALLALSEVVQRLNQLTGGDFAFHFDSCPQLHTQHVGILFDRTRVQAKAPKTIAEINPHGSACQDALRPGLGLHASLSDGTRVHLISVHLKSGTDARSLDLRDRSFQVLRPALAGTSPELLVGGDFNTMGCSACSVPISGEAERARRAKSVAPLVDIPIAPSCSHYYRGEPGLLDGFLASPGLASRATAVSEGVCGALSCAPGRIDHFPAVEHLSDHCPVVLELSKVALDASGSAL